MDINWLSVAFRWMHILPAFVAVGGTIFMWAALHPATSALPESERATLREAVRSRWSKWVMGAILFLLVSGFYNFFTLINRYEVPKIYQMLFGIKFLLALGIFALASFLTGRTPIAQRMRANAGPWLTLNVVLAVVLVCISASCAACRTMPRRSRPPRCKPEHKHGPRRSLYIVRSMRRMRAKPQARGSSIARVFWVAR